MAEPTSNTNTDGQPATSSKEETTAAALQFVTINEKGDSFELHADVLESVLSKVPEDMKVCVVCVVGAFRTGKSFLLDLFLRYLRSTANPTTNVLDKDGDLKTAWKNWVFASGNFLEGIVANPKDGASTSPISSSPVSPKTPLSNTAGFSWRPGKDRNTTGMWVWSEPFIRRKLKRPQPENGGVPSTSSDAPEWEDVAVLLVDTQGMFDMETSQMLTACIFGLSALISSYLIYNLDKRIQEDNLQHLALFTEYGRIALASQTIESDKLAEGDKPHPPFQTLDCLVRDWQDFDDPEDTEKCLAEMEPYLEKVLRQQENAHKDLKEVRDHIHVCFETPRVFMLPHPGLDVTKRGYNGDLRSVSPEFLALLHREAIRVFGLNSTHPTQTQSEQEKGSLAPKRIHGKLITAPELLTFVKSYVKVFHDAIAGGSAAMFPEAKTLLAATAEANNHNAKAAAVKLYKTELDKLCGSKQPYVEPANIEELHTVMRADSMKKFDRAALMGKTDSIVKFREELELAITEMYEEYLSNNLNKRPDILRLITILLMIGTGVYLCSSTASLVCWAPTTPHFDFEYGDLCTGYLSILRDIYMTVFCFVVLVGLTNGWSRIGPVVNLAASTLIATAAGQSQQATHASIKKKKE